MKCPVCKSEMNKGVISGSSMMWLPKAGVGGVLASFGKGTLSTLSGGKPLWAYQCSKCGKVELTTKA